jgi:hypothetical protein
MKLTDKERLEKLEREVAKIRKSLPKETPLPAVKNPPVIIHRPPLRIDRRKQSF